MSSCGCGGLPNESFNSFDDGALPPVRNQRSEGACWCFAALGSMEADLIHDGRAGTDIDLSELALGYYATHSYGELMRNPSGDWVHFSSPRYLNFGGNGNLAVRTLTNGVSPLRKEEGPYPAYGADYSDVVPQGTPTLQMTGAYYINPADTAGIKAAIRRHGGVFASIFFDYNCYRGVRGRRSQSGRHQRLLQL